MRFSSSEVSIARLKLQLSIFFLAEFAIQIFLLAESLYHNVYNTLISSARVSFLGLHKSHVGELIFCRQSGLRPIWEKYFEEAHAVIYVIDAASPSRFEDSKSALG